jgi:hypothetical protein
MVWTGKDKLVFEKFQKQLDAKGLCVMKGTIQSKINSQRGGYISELYKTDLEHARFEGEIE